MSLSVEQKLLIHELLGRAALAYDERDMATLEAGLAANATMSMRIADGDLIGPFEGREAIMKLFADSMAQQNDVRRHVVSNIFFDESGEHPVAVSNLTLLATAACTVGNSWLRLSNRRGLSERKSRSCSTNARCSTGRVTRASSMTRWRTHSG